MGYLIPRDENSQYDSAAAFDQFVPRWASSDRAVRVIFSGSHSSLSFEFELALNNATTKFYRVEFALKDIVRTKCFIDDVSGLRVLLFTFVGPPHCYQTVKKGTLLDQNDDGDGGNSGDIESFLNSDRFMSIINSVLNFNNADKWTWDGDLGDDKGERVGDPTKSRVFGHCLCYRVEIKQESGATKVIGILKKFGIRFSTIPVVTSATRLPSILAHTQQDWSFGYDAQFSGLSYDLKYLLHCLVSSHMLYFPDKHTAMEIEQSLSSIAESTARALLETMFASQYLKRRNPLQWLREQLKVAQDYEEDELETYGSLADDEDTAVGYTQRHSLL
ncbi:hypothetical protein HDV05_001546 [Chytridiales sp. JEL 0842]|nr:hypothetical protein HDV05_001546 [Chytridiales sp. JEL 0842]